jgi:hypothetical protein
MENTTKMCLCRSILLSTSWSNEERPKKLGAERTLYAQTLIMSPYPSSCALPPPPSHARRWYVLERADDPEVLPNLGEPARRAPLRSTFVRIWNKV